MTDKCAELKTVTLNVCDHPKLVIEKKDAQKVLQRVPQLRYVTVNGISWRVPIFFYISRIRLTDFLSDSEIGLSRKMARGPRLKSLLLVS